MAREQGDGLAQPKRPFPRILLILARNRWVPCAGTVLPATMRAPPSAALPRREILSATPASLYLGLRATSAARMPHTG
uniref:Uncharacterized protein n=1 Tax=Triticum urartu TaxID=4572 RepID=A0A8R7QSU2_TRIUA